MKPSLKPFQQKSVVEAHRLSRPRGAHDTVKFRSSIHGKVSLGLLDEAGLIHPLELIMNPIDSSMN
jgi:hypothetical protein